MIITTHTSKGGETKTTSTSTIGSILAASGYKVLLVDTDLQANLTFLCTADNSATTPPIVIYDLLLRNALDENELKDAIISSKIPNMDLIPANDSLKTAPYHLYDKVVHEEEKSCILHFRSNLLRIKELFDYDFILIDTAPMESYIVDAALAAADMVISGISADNLSWQGVSSTIQTIQDNNKQYARNTIIAGIFMTRVNPRTTRYKQMDAGYRSLLGDIFLRGYIRQSEQVAQANTAMEPILLYDRKCIVIEDYINIMVEMNLLDTNDWHYLALRKYLRTGEFPKQRK